MGENAVDAEYAALAPDYDRDWGAYNRATASRTLRALRERTGEAGRVLDVGCGTGALLEELGTAGTLAVGLDRSASMLKVARRRLPNAALALGDAGTLPYADETFNTVLTNSALHYADDPAACVRELARVTKPGGAVIWTDWNGGALPIRAVAAWLRLTRRPLGRVLSATEMAAALTDAGLKDVRTDCWRHGWMWRLATVSGRKPG